MERHLMCPKSSDRYSVYSSEDYEPNGDNIVLRNRLGVKSQTEMDALEEKELFRAEEEVFKLFDKHHQFTAQDIQNIHQLWLGDIYDFAGNYRTVTLTKDTHTFAAAQQIVSCMQIFERDILTKYTPCNSTDIDSIAYAIGLVHVELILIHPFREGNGRVARILADLMASQSDYPPLDYSEIDKINNPEGFQKYIAAIQAGMGRDYQPITEIFKKILRC